MRLDKFLSAARIFRSRSLAAEAISSSMVFVNHLPAKPSREVRPGLFVEIDTPGYYRKIEVVLLPPKNMSRKDATMLYRIIEERVKD